jgi:mannose-6-phosphate isomerase-like protein (cupin superfamily)
MLHFSIDDIKGKEINSGTINQRRIKLLASPKSPAKRDEYSCGMAIIPAGHVHEPHAHDASEELIYVVSGTGVAKVGGNEFTVGSGQMIAIDKGEAHQFFNTGPDELRLLWIYSPPGPEIRFLDCNNER